MTEKYIKGITLLNAIAGIIIFTFISFLVDNAILNALFSFFIVVLAAGSYWLSFVLLTDKDKINQGPRLDPIYKILMILASFSLALVFGYFSYWLLVNEPYAIMCKLSPCEVGPYRWSAAILSAGCSLFLVLVSYRLVMQSRWFNQTTHTDHLQ